MALCRALLALWVSVTSTALVNVELMQLALEVVGCQTLERPQLGLEVRGGTSRVGKGLGAGPGQSRGASSSTHLRNGRYPTTFRVGELQ